MEKQEQDADLLARYRRGDVGALETLVEKYRRPLFGYILNMTGGQEDADEIFQETWLRAIRKMGLYRQKNFFGWLVRICRNLVIDRARRRKPVVSLDREEDGRSMIEALPGGEQAPSDRASMRDLEARLAKALETLPEEQKEVFVMRMQTGLAFKEIAELQGVSINTALARMQYALAKLRPLFADDYAALQAGRA
jgi:RNA polymerase sigma-70 factor (ECF subfamily)